MAVAEGAPLLSRDVAVHALEELLTLENPCALYDVFITVRFMTPGPSVWTSPCSNMLSY